jgi:hypothetical protein
VITWPTKIRHATSGFGREIDASVDRVCAALAQPVDDASAGNAAWSVSRWFRAFVPVVRQSLFVSCFPTRGASFVIRDPATA